MHDFRLLLAARLLRAFGFGLAAVLVGIHLERRGLSPGQIGLALTIGLLAASLSGLATAAVASRVGRRVALAATGLLMALTGLDLALAPQGLLLVLAGVTGMLGAASPDLGPFLAIEQAMLAEAVEPSRRNVAFARYSVTGGLAAAAGGLAAGLGTTLERTQAFFVLYIFVGLLTAALALLLSRRVEAAAPQPALERASLKPLAGLSALFAVDALGGGLVVQAVIAYWLHVRFGAGTEMIGPAFGAIALVQAASYEIAGRLANRIGLVRTMVFTHLPSNVLLLLVPFSPNFGWAIVVLLARFSMSQMDVPTRQAYVVSIVPPRQRAGAVALTGAVRGLAQAIGPTLAGLAIQTAALGLPFYVAGSLKIGYDLSLYAAFRNRRAEHEREQAGFS